MIEKPVPFHTVTAALLQQQVGSETAASMAALQLGSAQMMYPSSDAVLEEFRSDTELTWPRFMDAHRSQISSLDIQVADEIAAYFSEAKGTSKIDYEDSDRYRGSPLYVQTPDATQLLSDFNGWLFGADEVQARQAAIALVLVNLTHKDPLIQVSAAIAALTFTKNPMRVGQAVSVLYRALSLLTDDLILELASVGLNRARQDVPDLLPMRFSASPGGGAIGAAPPANIQTPTNAALLVHGTLFQWHNKTMQEWWRPQSGDLHQYLKNGTCSNLYANGDFYRWSGGFSDYAREEAAEKLVDWLHWRSIIAPNVVAHSHGCNVAMLASHSRPLNSLVMLSCPVHWDAYRPGQCAKVTSIRVKWDLVIMADRGAQRFPSSSGIVEHVLPFWFIGHQATRESATWKARNLDRFI